MVRTFQKVSVYKNRREHFKKFLSIKIDENIFKNFVYKARRK